MQKKLMLMKWRDSLEQNIEWMAALKIQESILKRKYAKVQKAKKRLVKKINKK